MAVLTGIPAGNLLYVALSSTNLIDIADANKVDVMDKLAIDVLLEALDKMHRHVDETLHESR